MRSISRSMAFMSEDVLHFFEQVAALFSRLVLQDVTSVFLHPEQAGHEAPRGIFVGMPAFAAEEGKVVLAGYQGGHGTVFILPQAFIKPSCIGLDVRQDFQGGGFQSGDLPERYGVGRIAVEDFLVDIQSDADDASWMDINMPNPWNEAPLVNTDGVVWFRGSFCLPESAKGPATLCLGQIDDNDICWINGTKVGSTKGWGIHRRYAVPENILKSGENSIVVRVTDEMGGGGFLATPEQFRIEWNEGEPVNVNLSGKWKYAQGVSDEDFRHSTSNNL